MDGIQPRPTVMVVDDTPASLGLVLEALSERGFDVMVAESGPSALEQLQHRLPDLILLDVVMPGMDGFSVCRRVREAAWGKEIPIIFMTALEATGDKVTAFRAGAVDYITKPVHVPEVLARVGAHLEIRALRQSLIERNEQLEAEIAEREEAEQLLAKSLEQAVVIADAAGQIRFATSLALDLLCFHFGQPANRALPAALRESLRSDDARGREVMGRDGRLLKVHALSGIGLEGLAMIHLAEADQAPFPELLCVLGLTPRESEVLFWIAEGKTNPEIAEIVGASVRTVHKHVEHVLRKLCVENRQQAAIIARERLEAPAR